MSDVMILQNIVSTSWQRCLHVISDSPAALERYQKEHIPAHADVALSVDDLRLGHLNAKWALREVARVLHPIYDGAVGEPAYMTAAIWWIGNGRVSQAMMDAGVAFALETGKNPMFAFVSRIPAGAEEFVDVHGISLVRSDYVLDGFLYVTAGGMWNGLPRKGR